MFFQKFKVFFFAKICLNVLRKIAKKLLKFFLLGFLLGLPFYDIKLKYRHTHTYTHMHRTHYTILIQLLL